LHLTRHAVLEKWSAIRYRIVRVLALTMRVILVNRVAAS
jgi:hypothetical protein